MSNATLSPRGNLNKYQSKNPLQKFLIRKFLETICKIVPQVPPGPLCEVGCGEGYVLSTLKEKGLLSRRPVVGVDFDGGALNYAVDRLSDVFFLRGSAYKLPFPDKFFQCTMMLEVLEHLEQPQQALKEIVRVSNFLLVSVPHEPFFQTANFLRGKNLELWGNDPEHIQHWGQRSFTKLLQPYGKILHFEAPFPWLVAFLKV